MQNLVDIVIMRNREHNAEHFLANYIHKKDNQNCHQFFHPLHSTIAPFPFFPSFLKNKIIGLNYIKIINIY